MDVGVSCYLITVRFLIMQVTGLIGFFLPELSSHINESSHETVQVINKRFTGNVSDIFQVSFNPNKNINNRCDSIYSQLSTSMGQTMKSIFNDQDLIENTIPLEKLTDTLEYTCNHGNRKYTDTQRDIKKGRAMVLKTKDKHNHLLQYKKTRKVYYNIAVYDGRRAYASFQCLSV